MRRRLGCIHGTVQRIQSLLDIVTQFKSDRNVPVFCGEFGVYQPNSEEPDRVYWYEQVRIALEERGVSWTIWDYHGGFGLFNEGGQGLFDHDFNVPLGEALGFTVPSQTPYQIQPDTEGRIICDDFIGPQIALSGNQSGELNIYSTDAPNYGDFCISWTDAAQYNSIDFNFVPDRDFTQLVSNDFALDFFVRSNQPWSQSQFDVRFLDTDTDDPEDHPWRMRITVDTELGDGDAVWKHIRIPLKDFTEQGSWDDNQWHNPIGAYDWQAVDLLSIVAEYGALGEAKIWVDHMMITDVDTAVVNDNTPFVSSTFNPEELSEIKIWPNPTPGWLQITSNSNIGTKRTAELLNINGQIIDQFEVTENMVKDFTYLPEGFYLMRFRASDRILGTVKLAKGTN